MVSKQSSNILETSGFWRIGRWGCGQKIPYNHEGSFLHKFNPLLSGENFSILLNFKGETGGDHLYFSLYNEVEEFGLKIELFGGMLQLSGFPGLDGRYIQTGLMNTNWQQVVLVWNAIGKYWSLYFDGEEAFLQNFSGLVSGFDTLEIGAVSGIVLADDIAVWQRALSPDEIALIYNSEQPLNPQKSINAPAELELKHAWYFDEITGDISIDAINNLAWELPLDSLDFNGLSGKALKTPNNLDPYYLNIPAITTNNFSLSWWYHNDNALEQNSGRFHLGIEGNDNYLAEFSLDTARQSLSTFEGNRILAEGNQVMAHDNNWHHLALVYDNYRYLWQVFVDGVLKLEDYRLPILQSTYIDRLVFRSTYFGYRLDNFKIWQGALSPDEVLADYNLDKVD